MRILALLTMFATAFPSPALADQDRDRGRRLGVSIWGLSYHVDDEVDFDEANIGLGLRYYFTQRFFTEVDALRNSNSGLAVPVSAGFDLKFANIGRCALSAVAAGTVVYYENRRTGVDYVRAGPVPGITLACGRMKTNAIVVLRGDSQPVAVIAASLTIMLR